MFQTVSTVANHYVANHYVANRYVANHYVANRYVENRYVENRYITVQTMQSTKIEYPVLCMCFKHEGTA